MVGDEKPVYLEYDMPDADFIKKKNEEEDEEKNPSDDEMSICSIQSIDPELKSKLTAAVSDRNMYQPLKIQNQGSTNYSVRIQSVQFRFLTRESLNRPMEPHE